MRVSLRWLKDYVTLTQSAEELAERLTLAGIEPKESLTIGTNWRDVVIGRVDAVSPHPNADRLRLVTVDLGAGSETVVCGAPNVQAGQKIAFARTGARLVDPQTGEAVVLKAAKIRGVVSAGMVCSEKELGISEKQVGILVLPEEATVGVPLAEFLGDTIFDLEVTPNRPDCLSVIGIARELAALTGQKIRLEEHGYAENGLPIEPQISVEIAAPDLCPRYCASLVTGLTVGESPRWMQERLVACGMRPINSIVDITNYVMLEYGQPLHAFDYTALNGKRIIVRRAAQGEKLVSLDDVERELTPDMLVIADAKRPVAVAGVMGGANSEVIAQTTMVLLEAASFKPTSIHYTARSLHMLSEASMRFERGIRPELTVPALKRATQLILEIAGGHAARGLVDIYPGKQEMTPITLPVGLVGKLLGVEFSLEQIINALMSLGFECRRDESRAGISVSVPWWRSDIRLPVDLVEEVARVVGYDRIPLALLGEPIPPASPEPMPCLKRDVRGSLAACGFQEVVTFSLIGADVLSKLVPGPDRPAPAALRLANPMTVEQEYLRPTLRANLLNALVANRRFEEGGLRLFELGRVYVPRQKDLPDERETVCGVLCGLREEKSWHGGTGIVDFYDAKGVVEAVLEQLGVTASFETSQDESLHPNRQAAVMVGGNRVGIFGEVHPEVQQNFGLTEPVYLLEIDLMAVMPAATGEKLYRALPRFPAVVRDVALVMDIGVPHGRILDIMRGFSPVTDVAIFDFYAGGQVPPGKKSLAYRLTFQSPTRTLKDEEINGVLKDLLDKLAKEVGATLRG